MATDGDETERVTGLTLPECGRLISAVEREYGDDTPLSMCIQGRYVEGSTGEIVQITEAARKWGRIGFDTTLWGAYLKLDDAL